MLSVLENAYFRKAQEHPNFSQTHQKILFALLTEQKYYAKNELLLFANHCEKKLDTAIKELESTGTIKTEGWLVKINDYETLNRKLIPELEMIENKVKTKKG
ncbi:MAG: hypothetical protein WC746_01785 [archaeon]|jgi:hypothetical protein